MADLFEVLGLTRPSADCVACFEIYDQSFLQDGGAADIETSLDALGDRVQALLSPHLAAHLWQHEPPRLHSSARRQQPWLVKRRHGGKSSKQPAATSQQQQQQQVPCLWGTLRYEDCVEDEWYIAWLLRQVTAALPATAVRLWDDDGEFQLIEAAYALPRWLKPEAATHRVWLRHGELHIIPPPSRSVPHAPLAPSLRDALSVLASGTIDTRARRVEAALTGRLDGFPGRAKAQLQRVKAWLPGRAAALLAVEPQLVAPAVAAFMGRTRDEAQAAARLRTLQSASMTTALVTLNRTMYAQLTQADFAPPRSYPQPSQGWLGGGPAAERALALGAKLATGLEILAARWGSGDGCSSSTTTTSTSTATNGGGSSSDVCAAGVPASQAQNGNAPLAEALQPTAAAAAAKPAQLNSNPAWRSFVASLEAAGFFGSEREGSARHRALLSAAAEAFEGSDAAAAGAEAATAPGRRLAALLVAADAILKQRGSSEGSVSAGTGAPAAARGSRYNTSQEATARPAAAIAAVLDAQELSDDTDEWMAEEAAAAAAQLEAAEAAAAAHASRRRQPGGAAHTPDDDAAPDDDGGGSSSKGRRGGDVGGAAQTATREVDAEQLVSGFKGFVAADAGHEGAEVPRRLHDAAGRRLHQAKSAAAAAAAVSLRTAAAAAAATDEASAAQLPLDAGCFLRELLDVLGPLEALAGTSSSSGGGVSGGVSGSGTLPPALARRLARRLGRPTRHARQRGDDGDSSSSSSGEEESDSSSDEGSSFYDGSDAGSSSSSSCRDDGRRQGRTVVPPPLLHVPPPVSGAALQDAWEVRTATDSDDEGSGDDSCSNNSDDALSLGGNHSRSDTSSERGSTADAAGFSGAYAAALDEELAATTLAQTFEPAPAPSQDFSRTSTAAATAAASGTTQAGLAPLDVDLNLVRSLVASYTAQGGLPGPASNLAGLLGIELPNELIEEQ